METVIRIIKSEKIVQKSMKFKKKKNKNQERGARVCGTITMACFLLALFPQTLQQLPTQTGLLLLISHHQSLVMRIQQPAVGSPHPSFELQMVKPGRWCHYVDLSLLPKDQSHVTSQEHGDSGHSCPTFFLGQKFHSGR